MFRMLSHWWGPPTSIVDHRGGRLCGCQRDSHFTLAVLFTIAISRREVDLIIGRKFEFIYNDGI